MKKRILANLLCICMLVGLLPTAALAVEDSAQSPADVPAASRSAWIGDEDGNGTIASPWEISDTVTAYLEQNHDDDASPTYTCYIQGTGLCPNYNNPSETPWYTWIDQITKVVIGEGITLTGIDTFSDADALVEVELPSTLTQVNAYTFSGCDELERVTFPNGRAASITIANSAFSGCKKLAEFDFSHVDAFNWDSFSGAGLTKAVFPESVRWIGSSSFYGTPLKRVLIKATESPMEDNSSWPAFGNIAEESIIYVQNDSIFEGRDYSYTHHRTVIANLNGGEFAEGFSYDDEAFVLPQLKGKDGKKFDGWYISGTDVRLEGNIPVKDRAGDWFPAEAKWVDGTPDKTNIGDIGLILERPSHFISPAQVGDVTALSPHVTVTAVQWMIGDQPMATENFEYGNAYTVAVTVVLDEGYSWSGEGYINEAAATVTDGSESNQYILTYTFPTLEKQRVRVYGDNLSYTGTPRMEFELGEIHFPSSGVSNVTEGTTITMTIYPKRGYGIDEETLHVYRYTDRTQEVEIEPAGRNKYTFVMPSFDVYVPEPTFELQTYSITYQGLDGAVYDQEAYVDFYTVNDTVTLPDPTKEGFIFAGWKVNEEYLEYLPFKDNLGAYTINEAEDLVLTACWKSTEGVTLHVESFGGGPAADVFLSDEVLLNAISEYSYSGSLPNLSTAPELKGYEFLFWHVDYMDLAQYEDGLAGIRDSRLAQIQSLRESIKSEGNDLPEDILQTYLNVCGLGEYSWDHSLLLGNSAAVSGDFSAWYNTIAEQRLDSYIGQIPFEREFNYPYPLWYYLALVRLSYGADLPELTIYATYLKDGSIVDHYQLTYDSNGGTAYGAENYLDGTTATLDKTPTKSGYDFNGWYADSGLTQQVTTLTMDANKTVYAGWTPQSTEPDDPGTDPDDPDTDPDDPGTDPEGPSGGFPGVVLTYLITVEDSRHGDVDSDRTRAGFGSTVTLTATPDEGYELVSLTATDKTGKKIELTNNGDGEYTFKMPASEVTVTAVFGEISNYNTCKGGADCPLRAFTDANVNAWYHDGVHFCLDEGLMEGYGDGIFGPNNNLSRAQLVQILYNKEGRPAVTGESAFDDVAGDAWYADAVIWAAANGVVDGYGNGKFGPNDPITREQLAAILYRYAQAKGYDVSVGEDTNILSYTDALEISEYAIPAMQWACGAGVINGTGDGSTLTPQGNATRAQIATMLMRFCGYYADSE